MTLVTPARNDRTAFLSRDLGHFRMLFLALELGQMFNTALKKDLDVLRITETAEEVFERTKAREIQLSRLLVFYISGGLLFMLLPGTFLGVWNLVSISGRRAAESISPAWIQAHGHAQVLGWIGTFILGIGYYSIPKLRGGIKPYPIWSAWLAGVMWMSGVLLRWLANVYLWHWRELLQVSAGLELAAFLMFFRAVSQHKPQHSGKMTLEPWVWVCDCGHRGPAGHAALQSRCVHLAGPKCYKSRPAPSARSAVLDARCLGIHGALHLGFQREVASDLSGNSSAPDRHCAVECQLLPNGDYSRRHRLVPCCDRFDSGVVSDGESCVASVCDTRKAGQNKWNSPQLSSLRALCVRVADRRCNLRNLGGYRRESHWHLGCLTPRADCWLRFDDGVYRGSARLAGVFGNEDAVQS